MKTSIRIIALAVAGLAICSISSAETTAPKLISKSDPVYSKSAIQHNLKGTVVVEAIVNEDGKVSGADVIESAHAELDKAALTAVSNWQFKPATKDGVAVKQVVRIPIKFDLTTPQFDLKDPADTSSIAKN